MTDVEFTKADMPSDPRVFLDYIWKFRIEKGMTLDEIAGFLGMDEGDFIFAVEDACRNYARQIFSGI